MASEPHFVAIPLDMANDLRQWAEALSVSEGWAPNGHGATVLRQFKALLDADEMFVKSDLPAHAYVHGACNATVSAVPPHFPCRRFAGHGGRHLSSPTERAS